MTPSEFNKLPLPDQILEIAYTRFSGLVQPAFFAVQAAYPEQERKTKPKLEYKYLDAFQNIRMHRNQCKKNIKESILPLCNLLKRTEAYDPGIEDLATTDFRKLLVTQFDLLHKRLKDYASMLLPKEDVSGFLETLEAVYPKERERLLGDLAPEGISNYSVTPRFRQVEEFLKPALDQKRK